MRLCIPLEQKTQHLWAGVTRQEASEVTVLQPGLGLRTDSRECLLHLQDERIGPRRSQMPHSVETQTKKKKKKERKVSSSHLCEDLLRRKLEMSKGGQGS